MPNQVRVSVTPGIVHGDTITIQCILSCASRLMIFSWRDVARNKYIFACLRRSSAVRGHSPNVQYRGGVDLASPSKSLTHRGNSVLETMLLPSTHCWSSVLSLAVVSILFARVTAQGLANIYIKRILMDLLCVNWFHAAFIHGFPFRILQVIKLPGIN